MDMVQATAALVNAAGGAAETLDGKVRVRLVRVSPDIAARWLEQNGSNRHLRQARVKGYVADMLAGRWRPFSSMLVFAGGRLVDGQHRLNGVIESGIPQWFVVLERDDAEGVYDLAQQRTVADLIRGDDLSLFDGLGPEDIAPVVRALAILDLYVGIGPDAYRRRTRLLESSLIERFPEATATVARLRREYRHVNKVIVSPAFLAGMLACYREDAASAASFFADVTNGELILRDEPAYKLRQIINQGRKAGTLEDYNRVIYAFNAFVEGRTPEVIRSSSRLVVKPKRRTGDQGEVA